MLLQHGRWSEAEDILLQGLEDLVGDREHLVNGNDSLYVQLLSAHGLTSRLLPGAARPRLELQIDDRMLEHTAAGRVVLAQAAFDHALRGTSASHVRDLATRALGGDAVFEEVPRDGLTVALVATALTAVEELEAAERVATTAAAEARAGGSVLDLANACHIRSLTRLRQGRITEALADSLTVLDARRYGWKLDLGGVASVTAECRLQEGDLESAARALRSYPHEEGAREPLRYRYVGTRGHLRLQQHSPAAALADLLEAGRLQQQLDAPNPAVFPWRALASAAALATGDRSEARRLAEEEVSLASAFGAPGAIGIALGALAGTLDAEASLEALAEAVSVLESSALVLERARALINLGHALRRAERRRAAREPLRLGLDLASGRAPRLAERARAELIAAGGRPRRDAISGRESLTAREKQVAELAAQGMSNREIAKALFVTVKTVEWHLKHSYQKLSVGSRKELQSALTAGRPRHGATLERGSILLHNGGEWCKA